jgi:hypothetical protein
MLSESYKNKIKILAGLTLFEGEKIEYEYQLRDIGGPVFYKRKKGNENWLFISAEEFADGCSNGGKVIKWKK